jgi:hypothetical protein
MFEANAPVWLVELVFYLRKGGWKDGRVEGWRDGRVEGWKDGRMEDWKDGKSPPVNETSAITSAICLAARNA